MGEVGVGVTQGPGSTGVITGAVGVGAIRAGLAGAVGGFEEAWVAGRAARLHARGGQLHRPLQVLAADFRLGPLVHELRLQRRVKNGSARAGFSTSLGKGTLRMGGSWAIREAPPG